MTGKRRRWPRVLAAALSISVLAVTGLSYAIQYYGMKTIGNIRVGDSVNWTAASTSGPTAGEPINILLMGSDTRAGKNADKGYGTSGGEDGARSDTTILLHISGDRKSAIGVSIPRDSWVTLPMCKTPDGTEKGGYKWKFNEAFRIGGPSCTVKEVQELTGVPINHYIVVDFQGFKNVVDSLGGVEVCLNNPVQDSRSKLNLPAGKSVVKGEQALAFVRARYALGDGGDLARVQRQQDFLASAIRQATSAGTLLNPAKLNNVITSGARSMTMDPGLANYQSIRELAVEMSGIKPDAITFATVPNVDAGDMSNVLWEKDQADMLWEAIKTDQSWPPPPTKGADGMNLTAAPNKINVNVVNATGAQGQGTKAAARLTDGGYIVNNIDSRTAVATNSVVEYNSASKSQYQAARTLSFATGVPMLATGSADAVALVVGSDFTGKVAPVTVAKAKAAASVDSKARTAAQSVCAN